MSEYCSSSYGGYFPAPAKQQDLKGTGMVRSGTSPSDSTEINKEINIKSMNHTVSTIMPLKFHSLGIHLKTFDGSMPSAGWNSLVTQQSNTSNTSAIKGPAVQNRKKEQL